MTSPQPTMPLVPFFTVESPTMKSVGILPAASVWAADDVASAVLKTISPSAIIALSTEKKRVLPDMRSPKSLLSRKRLKKSGADGGRNP